MAADAAHRMDRADWLKGCMGCRNMKNQEENPEHAHIKANIGSVFDRIASNYDQIGPRIFTHFGRRLVRAAGISEGEKVLDVAAGRGAVLFPAAEAVGSHGFVTGIDLSAGMVEKTDAEIKSRKIRNAQVMQMDAENIDFPDDSFDGLLCGFSIFFFPHPEKALQEFHRVLKPGGRLGLTTFKEFFTGEWAWFSDLLDEYSPVEEEDQEEDDENDAEVPDFQTLQGLEKFLSKWGFTDIRLLSETKTFCYQDEDEWWRFLWSVWMRNYLEELETRSGFDKLNEFQQEAYRNLEQLKTEKGIPQEFPVLITLAVKP